jgi:hypothetical protein
LADEIEISYLTNRCSVHILSYEIGPGRGSFDSFKGGRDATGKRGGKKIIQYCL